MSMVRLGPFRACSTVNYSRSTFHRLVCKVGVVTSREGVHDSADCCVLQACTRRTSPSQVVGPAFDANCWQACSSSSCLLTRNPGSWHVMVSLKSAAMAIGADYVAPYLGRMDDAGMDVRTPLLWGKHGRMRWSG